VRTIVAGYDATEPSRRALSRAAEIAEAFGSRLVVVSVAPVLPLGTPALGGDPFLAPVPPLTADPELELAEGREAAEANLERARDVLRGRPLEPEYIATLGDPAEELVTAAGNANADLIVVGTREPGLVDRLLAGSVSQAVARSAHCDVLIVHPGHGEAAVRQ
jgi:nucleotide-binding universal stress UspA family protein